MKGLTGRMVAASVLLGLVIAAAFALLALAIDDVRDAERRTRGTQEVLVAANHLERLLLDLETGQRGFALTGEERFLEPWRAARAAFPRRAARLLELVAGQVRAEAEARQIAEAERSYIHDYSIPLVNAVRRGESEARGVSATAAGKRRVDGMRHSFDRLLDAERSAAARSQKDANSAARRASVATVIGLAGSLLLILLYVGYLARWIVRPIRRAASMATRLAGGDLSARMPQRGVGEIGELEHAFNVMARSLESSRDDLAARAAEQGALRQVATLVARGAPPSKIFAAVAEEVARLLPADRAFLGRFDPHDNMTLMAAWPVDDAVRIGVPQRVDEASTLTARIRETGRTQRIGSVVSAPITVEGRLWGFIAVASTGDQPLPPDAEGRLTEFTQLVATAVANAETQEALAASRARIVATADETRRRIERDLHDGAQQRLVSLNLQLRAAQASVPTELDELQEELERVATGLTSTLDELREYARGIHPAILAEGGLSRALRTLTRRSAVPVQLNVHSDERLPDHIEVGAYYIVSEALTNAAKHADASVVDVNVDRVDGTLRISIRDDGVGGAELTHGSGLLGLKDRVEALGGRISIKSPPGEGTSLEVRLPLADG